MNIFEQAHAMEQSKFRRHGARFRDWILDMHAKKNYESCTIRGYQVNAVNSVRCLFLCEEENPPIDTVLIVAPNTSGKSGIIVMLPYFLEVAKTLIITPSDQTCLKIADAFHFQPTKRNSFFEVTNMCTNKAYLTSFLETVTIITKKSALESSIVEGSYPVQGNLVVVTCQKFGGTCTGSLVSGNVELVRDAATFFAQFDLLIVTEAHLYPTETWCRFLELWRKTTPNKKLIFISATSNKTGSTNDSRATPTPILPTARIAYTITREMLEGVSVRKEYFDDSRPRDRDFARDIMKILSRQHEKENRFTPQALVLVQGKKEVMSGVVKKLNRTAQNNNFAVEITNSCDNLRHFSKGRYRVAVLCKVSLLEGYENSSVTLCVVLRKFLPGDTARFCQFIGQCIPIKRPLPKVKGRQVADRTTATILTYQEFGLRKLYEARNELASEHPQDGTDDEEEQDE